VGREVYQVVAGSNISTKKTPYDFGLFTVYGQKSQVVGWGLAWLP